MKRLLPGRLELCVFVVMATVAGVLVATSAHRDTMIFIVTMPLFLVASLLGLRRNLMLRQVERVKVLETSEMQNVGQGGATSRMRD